MADAVPLTEAADILSGRYLPAEEYDETGDYVIYGSNSIMGRASKPLYDGPLVIFARVGSNAGAVMFSDKPAWINNNAAALKAKLGWNARYLFYWASHFDLRTVAQGSGQPFISNQTLSSIKIARREAVEQEAIASVLGALDDKIELNRQMNETLEGMARAIFRDWFVDFGPTRAKMVGRAPYLAPDIWSLFPDRLDGEGKPEGWREGTLSEIAALNPESWSRTNYPDTVDYVDLSNTKWGAIEAITQFTRDTAPSRAQRILSPGDTIVGTVRPGNGSYAFVSENGLTGSTGFAVLRPAKTIFREFVYLGATSSENIDRLAHLADGGAYPAVRPELISATEIILPPENVFAVFSELTRPLVDRVEANKAESRTLAATRDLLLPKLMSGEIRVRDAEKLVGEAT